MLIYANQLMMVILFSANEIGEKNAYLQCKTGLNGMNQGESIIEMRNIEVLDIDDIFKSWTSRIQNSKNGV